MKNVFTKAELKNAQIEDFGKWYDNIKRNIGRIKGRLDKDLLGFAKQTGANLLAFFQVRIKSKESFLDKIDLIRIKEKRLDEVFGTNSKMRIEYIVSDLIGARFVMYFFRDLVVPVNYFATYPTFTIEHIKWHLLQFPKTPMTLRDSQNLKNRLMQLDKNCKLEENPRGYESLHLLVRYTEPFASHHKQSQKYFTEKQNRSVAPQSYLTKFPIEIQIRTILQHSWAQIEHKLNYSITKSPTEETINDRQFLEDFHCQKALLYGAECHQRIIYDRFLDLRRNPLALSKRAVEIDQIDLRDFDESEKGKLSDINTLLDSDPLSAIDQLKQFAADIMSKYRVDVLTLSFETEIQKWSRKRLVLAIIAYLLQNSNQVVCDELRKVLYQKALVDIDEIKVHEFIRNVDSNFMWNERLRRNEDDRIMVRDPVLSYRAAGSYIKYGDFRRGIYLLSEAINEGYLDGYPKVKGAENILTKIHFHRRIGEYYFFAYIKEGYTNPQDLVDACISMESANTFDEAFPNEEAKLQERSKVLANLIVMYFCRYIIKQEFVNPQAFYKKLEELDHEIKGLLENNDILSKKRVHAMEALSLYRYFCNRIGDARKLISDCRRVLDEKIKSDNVKNPLHLQMTDTIYAFINSNWLSENRVPSRLIEEPAEVR